MTTSGSHERFSELIGPFLREELSQDDARALEEHLSTCGDCRAEVAALRALSAAPGSLTEVERRDLHDGIKAALGAAPVAEVVPLSPRWAAAAKALSAAAVVALIAAAGIWVGTGGTGGSDDSASNLEGAADSGAGGDSGAPEGPRESRPQPSFLAATALFERGLAETDEGGDTVSESAQPAAEVTKQLLADLAENGPLFENFAGYYSAPIPAEDSERALVALAKQAPGADFRAQVEDCGADFLASRPGTSLSVAGLLGDYQGEEALVIGFATTEDPAGPLNRYTYVIWRVGSCDAPLSSFGGALLR
ncbi:MAG: zf-HC2 domain-containing protein [Actinobacteria bacterium]|nr:zf-HC2 domain-containing protein [Actinomycetota bacterium]